MIQICHVGQQGVVTLTQQQVEQLVAQGIVIQPISNQVQYQFTEQPAEVRNFLLLDLTLHELCF